MYVQRNEIFKTKGKGSIDRYLQAISPRQYQNGFWGDLSLL